MKAAAVVVNYNTRDLLTQSLASIERSITESGLDPDDVAVIVVDNASTDGSVETVALRFPGVRLIPSPENLGFARANNVALSVLGFKIAGSGRAPDADPPDYVLLLNPDAQLQGDALGRMVDFLDREPRAGACGARLEYADGTFQHGAFDFPTLMQVLLDVYPFARYPGTRRLYASRLNGRYTSAMWYRQSPFAAGFVLGAAMMMRGEAIRNIGGLDEDYFMYCEEMDWCLRLRNSGYLTYAVPSARVVHYEAQSSRPLPYQSFRRLWESRLLFYRKHPEQYSNAHLFLVRFMLRAAIHIRSNLVRRSFTEGRISGLEAGEALDAYAKVAKL